METGVERAFRRKRSVPFGRGAQLPTHKKYADLPMDLADATLVGLAEEQGDRRISRWTPTSSHIASTAADTFEIIPG